MPFNARTPLQYFLLLFVPLVLFVLVISSVYWSRDAEARLEVVQSREMAHVAREAQILETIVATRAADAAFLAELVAAEMAHGKDPARNIQDLFGSFAEVKRDYLMVRFDDARGMEKVRVNVAAEGPSRVPQSQLKGGAGRPAVGVPRDQPHTVHVSSMALLVEHGRIVEPHRPMVHFSCPVPGPNGALGGLVTLSLDGNVPLDRLRNGATASLGQPWLVNQRGYWLLGPSPAQEWGFHFPDRAQATIGATWPRAWERMRGRNQGQFMLNGALYTFSTVHPEAPSGLNQNIVVASEDDWLVVSRVAPEQLSPPQSQAFVVMTGGLLVLLATFAWIWAQTRTRRDQSLAELRSSEESARAILNAPQDAAFLLLDMDGRILTGNRVFEERSRVLFPEGLAGKTLWEIGGPELAESRRKLFDVCAQTGEPVRFDDKRQGMILDNTFYPVRGADGLTRQMVMLSREVTGERRAQQRLQTLSRAVEQSPAIIVITSAQGDIEYVNPSFTERYGYSSEEALGKNPRILKSGRHAAAFYREMWDALAEGRDWVGELCNRAKDGQLIWEKASISPVLDDTGQVTHYVAVKEDITEQRQARQALAENEEKIRAMSEASQDGLIMLDDKGLVVFWNRAAEVIFGYSREEVLGRRLHDFVTLGEDADKADKAFVEFSRSGTGSAVGVITELTTRRKDGTIFPAELSLGAFQLQGRWWAVGTVRDVTERKRAEALLLELATTDGLTGLANRRHFMERANAELGRSRRTGQQVNCIMFDVDHFKKVNDTHGHDVGDLVLKALARAARETLRSIDVLGRLGGEEFAAILPETGLEDALLAAERLRAAVAGMGLKHGEAPLTVTVSLGVAQVLGAEESLEDLLKRADGALYEAKQTGRNRVVASRPMT